MENLRLKVNGHGQFSAPDNETHDARFPLSGSPLVVEKDNVSLHEFIVKRFAQLSSL